jgi:MFS family permease
MLEISSQVVTHLPALHQALAIGRGGAAVLAASSAAEALVKISGGGAAGVGTKGKNNKNSNDVANPMEKILGVPVTPEGKSAFFMAVAMAFHYFGYSLARPVTVALFTSASTGYAGFNAAFPFAMAFVSPTALLLLMGYGRLLDRLGPQGALRWSTLCCSFVLSVSAVAIAAFGRTGLMAGKIPAVKLITGPLFVFREAYVQLLTSQYWSFIASVLTPSQSARWFGPIAGLTSIASAVAGVSVSPLVDRIGLAGSLLGTGLMLLLSLGGTKIAYGVASKYGFTPVDKRKLALVGKPPAKGPTKGKDKQVASPTAKKDSSSMFEKASNLFARVPVLKALFFEILASQGLATVLNVCFVAALGAAIPDDNERAGWVGVFFSIINVITMVLQFLVLPPLMTVIEPKALWRVLPLVSLLFTCFQAVKKNPSLYIVSASLLVMKVSEYSARRMLDEMVYVPLDFESRFVGKEVLGVFGYRFGKSLMSLGLSGLTQLAGEFGPQQLSILSTMVALLWMKTAWTLSNLVPTHKEAQDVYNQEHQIAGQKGSQKKPAPKKPEVKPKKK